MILHSEIDTVRLLILESLFIQKQTPNLNNDSQFTYFSVPCNHINLTEVFSFSLVLFRFSLNTIFNFVVENDARKAVKMFSSRIFSLPKTNQLCITVLCHQ